MSTDTPSQQVTPDELADKCEAWLQSGGASNIVDAYEAGYRAALAASPQPTAAHDQAAINELVAQELERIAEEPPINGNDLAHARVLLAARGLRGASAATTQPTAAQPVGKRLTHEEAARTDGRSGPFIWWGDVEPGAYLYASAAPTQATQHLLQDTDRKLFDALARDPNARQHVRDSAEAIKDAQAVAELVEALRWYGEQARLARLIHSEGDAGRHALAADGGEKARAALSRAPGAGMLNAGGNRAEPEGVTMNPTAAGEAPVDCPVGRPEPERRECDAPVCPWCDRQGWDTCGSYYDTYTCEARL